MNIFAIYTISFVALLLLRLFVAFISFKFSKEEELKFSEVFVIKNEIVDCLVIAFIFVLFGELNRDYTPSEVVGFAMVIFVSSIILMYNFLAMPIRAITQKKRYLSNQNLQDFLNKEGLSYNIRIIKGNITNAFATGFLPYTKTILIGERLFNKISEEDLKAVIYHEIGHLKLGHLKKLYFIALLCSATGILLNRIEVKIAAKYGILETINEIPLVVLVGLMYGGIFTLYTYVFQWKMEYQADSFAVQKVGAERYVQMLNKLNEVFNNRMVKGSITHPPLRKRIENAWKTENNNIATQNHKDN